LWFTLSRFGGITLWKRDVSYTDHKDLKYIFTQLDLNLRQQRCLELIKDYDIGINYRPGEAIMAADTLS
jgi:hypothetical protein